MGVHGAGNVGKNCPILTDRLSMKCLSLGQPREPDIAWPESIVVQAMRRPTVQAQLPLAFQLGNFAHIHIRGDTLKDREFQLVRPATSQQLIAAVPTAGIPGAPTV